MGWENVYARMSDASHDPTFAPVRYSQYLIIDRMPLHREMSEPVSVALTFPWMDGWMRLGRPPSSSLLQLPRTHCLALPYLALPSHPRNFHRLTM
jgi:hypothetical protein